MSKREQLRLFIGGLLERKGDTAAFADSDSLLFSGRIDSLTVLEIAGFLETSFAFDLAAQDFDQSCFDSIQSIMDLVDGGKKS